MPLETRGATRWGRFAIILLFPVCLRLKDGGSKVYRSIVGIYEVKSWKQMGYIEEGYATQKTGITVKLFGMKIFDNTKTEMETKTGESSGMDAFSAISTENFPVDMSAEEMLAKAESLGKTILLPIDTTIAKAFPNPIDAEIEVSVVDSSSIPADMMGLDIGPKTAELFGNTVKAAKTVIWNGPMGVFENPVLAKGTIAVAKALAEAEGATTIIGGGDSAAAVTQLGFADKMSHISTGGGASLELFEGKVLPGIACLNER